MANDNLRVSATTTSSRELLPTQAGTFDGQFGISCDTAENPLMLVQFNETTKRYDVVRTVSEEEYKAYRESQKVPKQPNTRRRLFGEPLYANAAATATDDSSSTTTHRRLQDTTPLFFDEDDPDALLLARECLCAPMVDIYATIGTFCPVGQDNCRIALPNTYRNKMELTCTANTQDFHSKYILPLAIFMFFMFGYLCFCSPKGRYAGGYMKRILHCWDGEEYEQSLNNTLNRMVQQQYDRRMRLERLRAYMNDTGRVVIPTVHNVLAGTRMPLSSPIENAGRSIVVLKTMKYKEELRRDQEEDLCTICLNSFQEGDRVGDIKCKHIFHVACLKKWIQRKNHCPLCQGDEMATPQEGNSSTATTTTTTARAIVTPSTELVRIRERHGGRIQ
jgi:hypothetical protein